MKLFSVLFLLSMAWISASGAAAVKIGVIGPFSGPFALYGKNFKAGIDAYSALHGTTIGADRIEILYRDLPTADPAQSKALAQELVIKEDVQYLAGFCFTPDALAVTPLLEQANVPMIVMNAAASSIVTKSPFVVRTSFTMRQTTTPIAQVALEAGVQKMVTAVSDYTPGHDAEAAFKTGFERSGGTIVDSIRMPMNTKDFAPILQRIKASGADGLFAFLPSGPPALGFVKAYHEDGLKAAGIRFFATGDLVSEPDLEALGEAAIGIQTSYHYAVSHASPENEAFVKLAGQAIGNPGELTYPAVGAYDGMHLIYAMIEATGGKKNAKQAIDAVKGLAWTSPRGPAVLDPVTRHITQNIYLREVVRDEKGKSYNKEIRVFEKQGDITLSTLN